MAERVTVKGHNDLVMVSRSRDRGGERYKERGRYGEGEGFRSKGRHEHREKGRESYETSDKKKDAYYKNEQEEGEIG